jgi:DNA-binding PadR family transcriptional regulator
LFLERIQGQTGRTVHGSKTPQRRVNRITGKGKADLGNWMEDLKERRNRLENILARYEVKSSPRKR